MRTASYILSAVEVLKLYGGTTPFAPWLKQYFGGHKKFGSKDRRAVAHLCYCYFRLGRAFENESAEERVGRGLFLTSTSSNDLLQDLRPEWNAAARFPLQQKLGLLGTPLTAEQIFPFLHELSDAIPAIPFAEAHLVQPSLYLRVRPGKKEKVTQQLADAGIPFEALGASTLALPNLSKTDAVLQLNVDAVVQDVSSQEVLQPLMQAFPHQDKSFSAWDCCAASGGKSILLKDLYLNVALTVSDVRSSILRNLHDRFLRAGIKNYDAFVKDVGGPQFTMTKMFDVVLCDAPCSGSGTWSRAPENLAYFKEEKIGEYASRQKWICLNTSKAVKPGGFFLYITCSVFRKENEEVVAHVVKNSRLRLLEQRYFHGHHRKGDTLFAALFTL